MGLAIKIKYNIWVPGESIRLYCFEVWINGRMKGKMRMDSTSAKIPPRLLGIEGKIE